MRLFVLVKLIWGAVDMRWLGAGTGAVIAKTKRCNHRVAPPYIQVLRFAFMPMRFVVFF